MMQRRYPTSPASRSVLCRASASALLDLSTGRPETSTIMLGNQPVEVPGPLKVLLLAQAHTAQMHQDEAP